MKVSNKYNLRVPGPTPLPPEILDAISQQMINHRGHRYEEIQATIIENLKYFFQTNNNIMLLTSSGMGGLEAAVVNFFTPRDKIASFTCGEFGNRWAEVAHRFGAHVIHIKFPPGESVSINQVKKILSENPDLKGVLFTHNETSTGVLNTIADFAPIVKNHPNNPLLLIDSISALGAVDLPMDKLGIDVLVTASQKAWMAPPGLAMMAVSQFAWEKHINAKMPRYYFDLSMYKEFAQKNQTPATVAVSVIFGLNKALKMMRREGREEIYRRHFNLMHYLRESIKNLGLELFAKDADASPTVTSIKIPERIDGTVWLKILREKYNVVLAGGMGETKGKIIRVAHMGWVSKKDLENVLISLEKSLDDFR